MAMMEASVMTWTGLNLRSKFRAVETNSSDSEFEQGFQFSLADLAGQFTCGHKMTSTTEMPA